MIDDNGINQINKMSNSDVVRLYVVTWMSTLRSHGSCCCRHLFCLLVPDVIVVTCSCLLSSLVLLVGP